MLYLDKCVGIVVDNAANQVLGVKLSGYQLFRCTAHTIQLAIQDAFNACLDIKNMIEKCKKIVKFFKKSGPAMRQLLLAQARCGVAELKLLQDIKTRWNSEFYMIYRVNELKEPLLLAMSHFPQLVQPTPDEWLMCEELIELLSPLEEATSTLSGRHYPTISMIIPCIRGVVEHLTTMVFHCEHMLKFRALMVKNFNERFEKFQNNSFITTATLLDPRFKKGSFEFKY